MGKHLVLVGGGHAHMTVLSKLDDYIGKGHRVTLVSPSAYHYYSGMGPGLLGKTYEPGEIRFHIKKMAEDRGATFVEDKVLRIEADARKLFLARGETVTYDICSFNTGSGVPMEGIAAAGERVIPVKPIINLLKARAAIIRELSRGVPRIVVVGGGAAGVEISANLWRLITRQGGSPDIVLVGGERLLQGFPGKVRNLALTSLASRDIRVREGVRVSSVGDGDIQLSDGSGLPYDFAFVAVGVRPSSLFRDSRLPVGTDGGLLVNRHLQSVAYPELFGGGDCINLQGEELAKVGVYAVRQNPILYQNLMAALEGGSMERFETGGSYLLILNMGDGKGILAKNGLIWGGRAAFWLKDYIDRRFMRRFQISGEAKQDEVSE